MEQIKNSFESIFGDNLSLIEDYIEYHFQLNPNALCLSLYEKGKWLSYSRQDFWKKVEYYEKMFSGYFTSDDNESASIDNLILFIKKLDIELLTAYIGAIKSGNIPAQINPVSPKMSEKEYIRKIEHILKITGAKYIFTDSESFAIPELKKIFTPNTEIVNLSSNSTNKKKISSDVSLVQFSSGSTGLQKGVCISHQALINHTKNYIEALGLNQNDKIITWLPLYHDMGLIACYLLPLMSGIPFWQIDPFDWIVNPNLLLKTIEEEKMTMCIMPNFAYNVLINKGKNFNLSSMKYFINCSEPIQHDTAKKFLEKFPSIKPEAMLNSYGLAENTMVVSLTTPGVKYDDIEEAKRNGLRPFRTEESTSLHFPPSSGHIVGGTSVKIFNPDIDGVGEIGVKGDYLFNHFIDKSLPLIDGYYLSGDMGYLSEDNQLFVMGRKKDMLVVNGKNIYPQDVENALANIPGVYPGRVVAFGVFNEITGSEELFVIVETDKTMEANQLKISMQKIIDNEVGIMAKRVEIVDNGKLIKTTSGKISRTRNKELYINGDFELL